MLINTTTPSLEKKTLCVSLSGLSGECVRGAGRERAARGKRERRARPSQNRSLSLLSRPPTPPSSQTARPATATASIPEQAPGRGGVARPCESKQKREWRWSYHLSTRSLCSLSRRPRTPLSPPQNTKQPRPAPPAHELTPGGRGGAIHPPVQQKKRSPPKAKTERHPGFPRDSST